MPQTAGGPRRKGGPALQQPSQQKDGSSYPSTQVGGLGCRSGRGGELTIPSFLHSMQHERCPHPVFMQNGRPIDFLIGLYRVCACTHTRIYAHTHTTLSPSAESSHQAAVRTRTSATREQVKYPWITTLNLLPAFLPCPSISSSLGSSLNSLQLLPAPLQQAPHYPAKAVSQPAGAAAA